MMHTIEHGASFINWKDSFVKLTQAVKKDKLSSYSHTSASSSNYPVGDSFLWLDTSKRGTLINFIIHLKVDLNPGQRGIEHRVDNALVESVVGQFVGEILVCPAERSVARLLLQKGCTSSPRCTEPV
eukprot:12372263-Ditylum_brightwellii.AAC.1